MPPEPDRAVHLTVDQLSAHLERRLRGNERDAVVSHLADCAHCRREYIDAGHILGAPRTTWRRVGVGVGLAAAAAIAFVILPRSGGTPDSDRAPDVALQRVAQPDDATPIRVASPVDGERITSRVVVLAWHPDRAKPLYRVTVETEEGSVIWRTTTIDTTVAVPDSVALKAGSLYYWLVDGVHADGRTARLPAVAFRR